MERRAVADASAGEDYRPQSLDAIMALIATKRRACRAGMVELSGGYGRRKKKALDGLGQEEDIVLDQAVFRTVIDRRKRTGVSLGSFSSSGFFFSSNVWRIGAELQVSRILSVVAFTIPFCQSGGAGAKRELMEVMVSLYYRAVT